MGCQALIPRRTSNTSDNALGNFARHFLQQVMLVIRKSMQAVALAGLLLLKRAPIGRRGGCSRVQH